MLIGVFFLKREGKMKNKKYNVLAIVFYLVTLAIALGLPNISLAGTIQLPKTGQSTCYDTSGNLIPCAGTEQDGDIQTGVAWPDPRFNDNADGTVTDNLTGLMWIQNANLSGYMNFQQALDYVKTVNVGNYTDWRLPNVNEFESIINAQALNSSSWLNSQGFTNVQSDWYWTSTTGSHNKIQIFNYAWQFYAGQGNLAGCIKSGNGYIWPVRGNTINIPKTGQTECYDTSGNIIPCAGTGQDGDIQAGVAWPNPRFNDNGDGTVTDNLTGLMWTKDLNQAGTSTLTWQQALDYIKTVNVGEHTDWRLPNIIELRSVFDYSKDMPALPDGTPFINMQSYSYWSSTTCANNSNSAWNVWSGNGLMAFENKSRYFSVWPVRDGLDVPTVIKLSSFTATPKASRVGVDWSTASEIENAGFNLYRSESEEDNYSKINTALIPAKGSSTQGASYEFIDTNVQNRKTYYYKLEDIDINGISTLHGPVKAVPRIICGISNR
jgi:hypothetical protein